MNGLVIFNELFLEKLCPEPIDFAKSFSNVAVELIKSSFLRSAFNNHGWQFILLPSRQIDAHKLVTSFLKSSTALDCQIY